MTARANVCRSGVTRAALLTPSLVVQIAGVAKAPRFDSLTIVESVTNDPNRCDFILDGVKLNAASQPGPEVVIGFGSLDNRLFAGHVVSVAFDRPTAGGGLPATAYHCTATDYAGFLLDAPDRVYGRYTGGANTVVARLLATYGGGFFRPGSLPSSLGNVDLLFADDGILAALQRVAAACSATLLIDYHRYVHLVATAAASGVTLTDTTAGIFEGWSLRRDISQIRNRVRVVGGGASTLAVVPPGATTMYVDETGWYSSSGGTVVADGQVLTYTGVTVTSGPGHLLGVSGVSADISVGTTVAIRVQADDAGAQATLAALVGGGFSGVRVAYITDGRIGIPEATGRAAAELAKAKDPQETLMFTMEHERSAGKARWLRPGTSVAVSVTDPETITATYPIESIEFRLDAPYETASGLVSYTRRVTAGNHLATLRSLIEG